MRSSYTTKNAPRGCAETHMVNCHFVTCISRQSSKKLLPIYRYCVNISLLETHVSATRTQGGNSMSDNNEYYLVKKKAVPEVLLKVVEAKKILEMDKSITIQEAAEKVGLGRSSFYKYKDDIFPFRDDVKGKTITFVLQMNDKPGQLSKLLKIIADSEANILTIHQTIPINGMASLTLSVAIPSEGEITDLITDLEKQEGVYFVKVLSRE